MSTSCASFDQVLAVVENEQDARPRQRAGERSHDFDARLVAHVEGGGHGLGHETGVGDHRQLHLPRTTRVVVDHLACHLEGEPGLAAASRPGERDQRGPTVEQGARLAQLRPATHERRALLGQVAGRGVAAQPREVARQAGVDELVQTAGVGQVLEPVVAEVARAHPRRPTLAHLVARDVGQHHLSAVGRRADARRLVHGQADVVVARLQRRPGVQADAHAHVFTHRPRVGGEGVLGRVGGRHRVGRPLEGGEHGVALEVDDVTAVRGQGVGEQREVRLEHVGVPVAQPLQQVGRPLDVGEQERDRPRRQPSHASEATGSR